MLIIVNVALAQSPGISGTVAGAAGPIPGVSVTVLPSSGGIAKRTATGDTGAYRLEALVEGTYRVDFDVSGFDLIRRNHVRARSGAAATVDATLPVSSICECMGFVPATPVRERAGQVVDESSRPLPHARLEVVSPSRREVGWADNEGRFQVRLPVEGAWRLTASDSGFRPVTQKVSGSGRPILLKLSHDAAAVVPDHQRFSRGCRCPGDLFTHQGR
jgi:hypothetical protein